MHIENCVQKEGDRKGRRLQCTGATAGLGSVLQTEESMITPRLSFTVLLKAIVGPGKTRHTRCQSAGPKAARNQAG